MRRESSNACAVDSRGSPVTARARPAEEGAVTTEQMRQGFAEDAALYVGQPVIVRWGYGLGFRASGPGTIAKINRKSVQVRLTAPVTAPSGAPWPAGFVLTGIPRFASDAWQPEFCVEPQ